MTDRNYGHILFTLFVLFCVIGALMVAVRAIYNALTKPKKEEENTSVKNNVIMGHISPSICNNLFRQYGTIPKECMG